MVEGMHFIIMEKAEKHKWEVNWSHGIHSQEVGLGYKKNLKARHQ